MKKLSLVLSLTMTAIIFLMSAIPGSSSEGMSLQITDHLLNLIDKIIPTNNISIDSLDHIVRKTAHITEYSVLGILWFITAVNWGLTLLKILFFGLSTAALDEIIQTLSVDRGASIIDVLLFDFLPFMLITILITAIYNLKSKGEDIVISDTLTKLAGNEISTKKAYREIYNHEKRKKIRFTNRAHFIKLQIHVPGEKGVNKFFKILFFLPFPIFLARPFLRFAKWDSEGNIPLSKTDLYNLISAKGINVVVNSKSGEKVYIKTI